MNDVSYSAFFIFESSVFFPPIKFGLLDGLFPNGFAALEPRL